MRRSSGVVVAALAGMLVVGAASSASASDHEVVVLHCKTSIDDYGHYEWSCDAADLLTLHHDCDWGTLCTIERSWVSDVCVTINAQTDGSVADCDWQG